MNIIARRPFKHVPVGCLIYDSNANCLVMKTQEAVVANCRVVNHTVIRDFTYELQEGGLGYYNGDAEVLVVSKDFFNEWRKQNE